MADDLRPLPDAYETDFYAWSQAQAALIARMGEAGRLPPELDWRRLAEEVGDLGKRDLRGAQNLVRNIIAHLALLEASQREEPKRRWRAEILVFQQELRDELTPCIRARLLSQLERLHEDGLARAAAKLAAHEPEAPAPPGALRWTLQEILGG